MSSNFQRHSLGPLWLLGYSGMAKKVGPRARNGTVAPRAIERHRQGMGGSGKVSQRHLFFVQPKHVSENLECILVTDKRVSKVEVQKYLDHHNT